MLDINWFCYRYYPFEQLAYNEETIWRDIQAWGGWMTIRGDCVDFFVPRNYITFFVLKYPELMRQPALDYV